jgi:hypothetical protein
MLMAPRLNRDDSFSCKPRMLPSLCNCLSPASSPRYRPVNLQTLQLRAIPGRRLCGCCGVPLRVPSSLTRPSAKCYKSTFCVPLLGPTGTVRRFSTGDGLVARAAIGQPGSTKSQISVPSRGGSLLKSGGYSSALNKGVRLKWCAGRVCRAAVDPESFSYMEDF